MGGLSMGNGKWFYYDSDKSPGMLMVSDREHGILYEVPLFGLERGEESAEQVHQIIDWMLSIASGRDDLSELLERDIAQFKVTR